MCRLMSCIAAGRRMGALGGSIQGVLRMSCLVRGAALQPHAVGCGAQAGWRSWKKPRHGLEKDRCNIAGLPTVRHNGAFLQVEQSALERRPSVTRTSIKSAPSIEPDAMVARVAALMVMSRTGSCLVTHTVSYIGSTTSHVSKSLVAL
jgi:hypothetical protein